MPLDRKAFVLMPFSTDFNDVYELWIREACEATKWECARIDERVFVGLIIEKLYDEISRADLIIADMSGQNPNVFYKVGYAHALNKRVILLTKSAEDIPFDLRGHRHVIYGNSISKLKKQLKCELGSILSANLFKEFLLGNLLISVLQPREDRIIIVDNYTSLEGGQPLQIREGLEVQVPGEISNYGQGVFFEFAIQIQNAYKVMVDISDMVYRISSLKRFT